MKISDMYMISSNHFPIIFVSPKAALEILNQFSGQNVIIEKFSSDLSKDLYPDTIPKISKNFLNQFKEMLDKKKNIKEILSPIKDLFRYDSNRIIYYINNFQTYSKKPSYATILLTYSVIAFISTPDLSAISNSFLTLLEAIVLSKKILPRDLFVFSLSSCVARYGEEHDSSTLEIVKKVFPDVQSDLFDLFTYELVKSLHNNDDESYEYLLTSLNYSVLQDPHEFENCSFLNILSFLFQKILIFDPLTLRLIDSFTYVRQDDKDLKECLESIPIYFLPNISSSFKICEKGVPQSNDNQVFRFSYDFETKKYFTDGLVPLPTEFFDRNFTVNFDIEQIIITMTNFLQNLEKSYFYYFFDVISVEDETIYFIFINLVSTFSKKIVITDELFDKMLNPTVFAPNVTLFDYKEEYNNIFYIRRLIFDVLIKEHKSYIISLLVSFNRAPLLFSEFIGRLHCNLSLFDTKLLNNNDFINSVVQVMMLLKSDNSEVYQKARSTLDLFIFSIFKDESSVRNRYFESSIFVNGYFTSIFEPTLHVSIMNSYLNYLQNFDSSIEKLKPSIEMLSNVITFCENVEMTQSILHSFIDILSINQRIKGSIAPFIDSITEFLHLHPSQNFLNEVIQLYLHCDHQFEMKQIRDLSDSIHKINGDNDPDDQLILNFLCLISNSLSASLHIRFIIHNESLLISFFSIFQTSQKAKPIFDLFYELCKYSPFNCYKCNKAEIDMLFIEMIKHYPSKFNFRGCRMNSCIIESKKKIIDILCLILTVRSSIPVCIKMISLLKYSSPDCDIVNLLLQHLFGIRKNIQPIGLHNNNISSHENIIKSKDIENGFSFICWIRIDEGVCHYSSGVIKVLSIIDDNIQFYFNINKNSLLVATVKSPETVHKAILYPRIPSGVWTLVKISFSRIEKDDCYLYYSLNSDPLEKYSVKNLSHFSHNSSSIYLGQIETIKPIKSVFPVFIGDYFFYNRKLKESENNEYYQKNEFPSDYLFRNEIVTKTVFPNFLDIFLTADVHQFILPYFYLCSDSSLPNMFLESLLNILSSSINYKEGIDFDFKVYSYALKLCDKITFSLYQRFFSILDNSISTNTMKSLVYDILLNFEIWTRTKKPQHLYRIVQNWGNSLFDSCSSVLNDLSIIFMQIPVYFSFTDQKNKAVDFNICRQNIDKLLLSIASVNFSYDNILSILSHCAISEDPIQSLYNFDLLYHICKIRNDIPISTCELLFYFLKPYNEEQFVAALKIIYVVSNNKFPKFLDSIFCLLNSCYFTRKLLDLLLGILSDFPLIYPLVILIAINLKSEKIDLNLIAQSLLNLKIPFLSSNWIFMPLILFAMTNSMDVILFCSSNMVDNFSFDAFNWCIDYIDFLGSILNFNFEEFSLKFAKINIDFFNNENIVDAQKMFSICSRLLLINNQPTFSIIDKENCEIFNQNDFEVKNTNISEFSFINENYLNLIQKDLSNQTFYFRVCVGPLMMSLIRLYQAAKIDIPLFSKFWQFFVSITKEKKSSMKLSLLESLNSLFPYYYANACEDMNGRIIMFQKKQIEYWKNAKDGSVKFVTSFGTQEVPVSVSNIDYQNDVNTRKIIESKLKKNVLSQFSIWSFKKLYPTQVMRVFQYSNLFHQIRLKKSDDPNAEVNIFAPEQNHQASTLKNLNTNTNSSSNSNSNSNSNVSFVQDSDYSSTLSDTPNSHQISSHNSRIAKSNSKDLSENAFFKAKCVIIKINMEIPADFTLETDKFIVKTGHSQKVVMLNEITHIFKRNRFQVDNSVEFILVTGHSIFLDFSPLSSNTIFSQFRNLRCDNLKTFESAIPRKSFEKSGFIEKWKKREISNFEYLMALNMYSGRSFKDSNLYPIFPWILTNYSEFENNFPSSRSSEFGKISIPKEVTAETPVPDCKKSIAVNKTPNSAPFFRSMFGNTDLSHVEPNKLIDTLSSDDDDDYKPLIDTTTSESYKDLNDNTKDENSNENKDVNNESKDANNESKDANSEGKDENNESKDVNNESKDENNENKEANNESKDENNENNYKNKDEKNDENNEKIESDQSDDESILTPKNESNSYKNDNLILRSNGSRILSNDETRHSVGENKKKGNNFDVYITMNRSTSYIFDESSYRNDKQNLSKPIAIQTEEKYHEFNLKFSIDRPISRSNCTFAPSSTAIIAHWLIRQPPFTQLHLKTENGKFGYPSRLFQTMSRAVYQALNGTFSWELCPEFFSFPEIFVNLNKYKMGSKVKSDVFSLDNAIEFVYIHRKALESEEVSTYLNNWIDLIFGCKTRNAELGNVYSSLLSDDVWKTCSSKYSKNFIIDTLRISGQLPICLFPEPHPKRNLLVSPYSNENMAVKQVAVDENKSLHSSKIFSVANLSTINAKKAKQRQKIQSKIFILTDKVDITEMLKKEMPSIISRLSEVSSTEFSNVTESNFSERLKIKHVTFLKKVTSESLETITEECEEYIFLVELFDFVFCTVYVNFNAKTCRFKLAKEKIYKSVKRDVSKWNSETEKEVVYSDFSHGFVVFNMVSNEIYAIRKSTIIQHHLSSDETKDEFEVGILENEHVYDFLCCSGDEFCIGNSDAHFDIFLINNPQRKLNSFEFVFGRVSCFGFSQSYGVVVIGTVNGFVYIVDSKSGNVSFRGSVLDNNSNEDEDDSASSKSAPIFDSDSNYGRDGKIPKQILITEGFGFIVVYCDDQSMFIFSINGSLIRKRKLGFAVKNLIAFKGGNGFDYIVTADSKGGIRIAEAFYLDFDENPFYSCRSEILFITYEVSYDAILVMTKNGSFYRIPTNTNQWIM